MSIANLFQPNNYDLFCDSLTANTLNVDTQAINTLAVNTITSNPTGGTIAILDNVNMTILKSLTAGLINVGTIQSNIPGNNVTLQGIVFYPTNQIEFPAASLNRKLSLFATTASTDTTEFYGFGVQPNTLVYETPSTSADHVFYAGTGVSTNIELLRVVGNGGGVILPSVGAAFASQLNYYEIFDTTLTLGGAIQSVALPANFSITRLGNTVTITCLSTNLGAYLTTGAITTTPAIPSRFLPTINITSPILVYNGNTDALGTFQILTSGIINIWSAAGGGYSAPNFSNIGAIGFPPFSISYNLT